MLVKMTGASVADSSGDAEPAGVFAGAEMRGRVGKEFDRTL